MDISEELFNRIINILYHYSMSSDEDGETYNNDDVIALRDELEEIQRAKGD